MRGIDYDGLDRSIDGRVSKLRRKLGDDAAAPTRIKTVWGKGYLLVPDAWEVERLKEWLAAGERGLFIRSYVVLAGGLLIVAMLLDLGFGALQARQVRAADPWLVSTLRLMENDLAAVPADARAERAAELGRHSGSRSTCSKRRHLRRHAAGDLRRASSSTTPARCTTCGARRRSTARSAWARSCRRPKDCWRASCRCSSTRPSC